MEEIIAYTQDVTPTEPNGKTYYPGERSRANKINNQENGMKVNEFVWKKVIDLMNN